MNGEGYRGKTFPVVALLLGFLPTALVLAVVAIDKNPSSTLLILGAIGTLVCCFGASLQLFRHSTALAVVAGVLLLLLNGALSLLLGCGAILSGL